MRNFQGPPKPVEFKSPPSKPKSTAPTGPVIHTAAVDAGNVTGEVGAEGKSTAFDMAGPRQSGAYNMA
eukprot:627756-Karenia_brevis.AAC.1